MLTRVARNRDGRSSRFGHGTSLTPVPPVAPIGMGKNSRSVDLEAVDDIDEYQLASWMKQSTALLASAGRSDEPWPCVGCGLQ
jgi:hypothetical protein